MTDSQNMTESNQQNGKEKLHANPVSAHTGGQAEQRIQPTSCPPNSSGLPLAMWL